MPGPKVECQICNDIIQSHYRHDFVKCFCGQIYVDGGGAYLRVGYQKPGDYKILEEVDDG